MVRYLLHELKWSILVLIFSLIIAVASFHFIYDSPALGENALSLMTSEQKRIATKVLRNIPPIANVEEISILLGEPIGIKVGRVTWQGPSGPNETRINVYFFNGNIIKIMYFSTDPLWGWNLYSRNGKLHPSS